MRYLIVGNSAAGVTAAECLRNNDADAEIAIVDREEHPFYSRVLTSYVLGGSLDRKQIFLRQEKDYVELGIDTFFGREAVKLHTGLKKLELADGTELKYDKLLLATGASPQLPPVEGADLKGVFTLRSLADVDEMEEYVRSCERAIVSGGGLVSIKTVEALLQRGMEVIMVVSSAEILSRILSSEAANLIRCRLEEAGVEVQLQDDIVRIEGKENAAGVRLKSGREISANLIVFGKGVSPNLELVAKTPISTDRGILVDYHLATTESDVYAAGDVAQVPDLIEGGRKVHALWSTAVEQGKFAAYNMAGKNMRYPGAVARNSFVFNGFGVLTAGRSTVGEDAQVQEYGKNGTYRQVILQGNRLVGSTAVGTTSGLKGWFGRVGQEVFPEEVDDFLMGKYSWGKSAKKVLSPAGISL